MEIEIEMEIEVGNVKGNIIHTRSDHLEYPYWLDLNYDPLHAFVPMNGDTNHHYRMNYID